MGPNDYTLNPTGKNDKGETEYELVPGLGKDELSDEQRLALRSKGAAAMQRIKAELEAQSAELSERELALEKKEHDQRLRELQLEAQEKRLRELEARLAARLGEPTTPPAPSMPPASSGSGSVPPGGTPDIANL